MPDNCLEGRGVLLTRAVEKSASLAQWISDRGGRALLLPALETQGIPDPARARQQLNEAAAFDALIFISRNAVSFALELVPELSERHANTRIFTVGKGSRDALLLAGFKNVVSATGNRGSEALLAMPELQKENVESRKLMILRGTGGRELLADELRLRGAKVEYTELYCRVAPDVDARVLQGIWQEQKPDVVVINSGEAIENLLQMTSKEDSSIFRNTALVVISDRLQGIARKLGFEAEIVVADGYSDEDVLLALEKLFNSE